MNSKTSKRILGFKAIFIWVGAICTALIAFLAILGWLYGIGDYWIFRSQLAQEISKIPEGGVKVPIQEKFGRIFINGTINGKRRVTMLVDTGCGAFLIDRSLVNEIKLPMRFKRGTETPDQRQELQRAIIPELKIGTLVLRSVPVLIDDLHIRSYREGHQIDGILGNTVINSFATTFDNRRKVIIFEASDKLKPSLKALKVQCSIGELLIPYVVARLNNKIKQTFIVDTGAANSIIPKIVLKQLALQVIPAGQFYYGSGCLRKQGQVKVSEFNLNGLKIQNKRFCVDLSEGTTDNAAVLGNDFLNKFRFSLNTSKDVLFLEPYPFNQVDKYQENAMYLIDDGKYREAIKEIDKGIRVASQNAKLLLLHAEVLYQLKLYKKSVAELTQCINLCGDNEEVYYQRASAYEKLGDRSAATQDILKYASMSPTDPFVQLNGGLKLAGLSADQKAIDLFNKAVELQSDIGEVYLARSQAYEKGRDYKKALEDCETAINLYPHEANYFNNRAWVRNATGKDFDKSIEDCNEAIKIDPNFAAAYRNRAVAFIGKDDYSNAITDLNKSLALDSTSERAGKTYYLRSSIYKKLGNSHLAEQDEKKSKQLGYNPKED